MTDLTSMSRAEFVERYRHIFDKLFTFDEDSNCHIQVPANWECLEFDDLNLHGWSADEETFRPLMNFISVVAKPVHLVLVEVESLERFTEAWIVVARRERIDGLWNRSHLPHFKTACFDDSA